MAKNFMGTKPFMKREFLSPPPYCSEFKEVSHVMGVITIVEYLIYKCHSAENIRAVDNLT